MSKSITTSGFLGETSGFLGETYLTPFGALFNL